MVNMDCLSGCFYFHPSEHRLHLCNNICSCCFTCLARTIALDITHGLVPSIVQPALLTGTIDFNHFTPLAVASTLIYFLAQLSINEVEIDLKFKQFSLNIIILFSFCELSTKGK